MVVSEPSDAILALGKQLISQLKLGKTNDTLARWMIHYLAELIKQAEDKSDKDYAANREKCFDTILALWRHRHELPDGKRPFEQLEPALRAMESLDPKNLENRYFPFERPPLSEAKESKETRKWLELAESLDYSARILIRHCISMAASTAINKSRPWVTLAEKVGGEQIELPLLRIILVEDDLSETDDATDGQRKILEDRLGKLRSFLELARTLAADYELQLRGSKPKRRNARMSAKAPAATRLKRPEQIVVIDGKSAKSRRGKREG